MNNILVALHTARVAFLRANLSPPDAIILASHEDGMRFLSTVKQDNIIYSELRSPHYKPVEHPDGSVWMEVEVAGMKIRWPANRRAMETGGYRYE